MKINDQNQSINADDEYHVSLTDTSLQELTINTELDKSCFACLNNDQLTGTCFLCQKKNMFTLQCSSVFNNSEEDFDQHRICTKCKNVKKAFWQVVKWKIGMV